jgi:hypothetical protein
MASVSPVMHLGSKETNVISDRYWVDQRPVLRNDASLSASLRVHAGSVDDVTIATDLKSSENDGVRVPALV